LFNHTIKKIVIISGHVDFDEEIKAGVDYSQYTLGEFDHNRHEVIHTPPQPHIPN